MSRKENLLTVQIILEHPAVQSVTSYDHLSKQALDPAEASSLELPGKLAISYHGIFMGKRLLL